MTVEQKSFSIIWSAMKFHLSRSCILFENWIFRRDFSTTYQYQEWMNPMGQRNLQFELAVKGGTAHLYVQTLKTFEFFSPKWNQRCLFSPHVQQNSVICLISNRKFFCGPSNISQTYFGKPLGRIGTLQQK